MMNIGTLSIESGLTINSDASYRFELNSSTGAADEVIADGVTINSATLHVTDLGGAVLIPGTTFTLIDNTSVGAIVGNFINVADDSFFKANGNIFLAD